MFLKKSLLIISLFVFFNGLALSQETEQQDCVAPTAPIVPDGNVASEDELVAAQKAVKAFEVSTHSYQACLEVKHSLVDPETQQLISSSSETNTTSQTEGLELYAVSADALTTNANDFNLAVRAFKSR